MMDVLTLASEYNAQLAAKDAAAIGRMVRAYRRSFDSLQDKLELLLRDISTTPLTSTQLHRMQRYQSLMAQVVEQLNAMQALTRAEVETAVNLGIDLGGQHARGLIAATMADERLAAVFNTLPKEAIRQLLGFLSPEGELYKRLGNMSFYGAQDVADALTQAMAMGWNPVRTAKLFQLAFGANLTDALMTVRTAQLWAYREANRATYIANSDVVEGWVWDARLDANVCASCVAMHGTIHPLSEPLDDHYNGRCRPIPLVKGFPPIITETGEQWFRNQPEAVQRQLLGPGKYEALSEGKFEFSALSTQAANDVYGSMRVETTLEQLLGGS